MQTAINELIEGGPKGTSRDGDLGDVNAAAVRDFIAARNALSIVAPDSVVQAALALGTEFGKVQAKGEVTKRPPVSPESSTISAFIDEVRVAAGIASFTKRTSRS